MKRSIILISIFIASVLPVLAQNMKVISFKLLENDLTANRYGTSKTDQNGETAALIKIVTPEKGFTFDGGSLGVVATEDHIGEIWLYVPRRAQKLIIQHQDYGVLRDFFYPVPIEGGKTYEMLIDIGTGRYATILSGLAQADLYVDGELCGQSPVRKYLNYGRHIIRAIKDRYEGEIAATITTGEDQDIRIIRVDMQDMSHLYGNVTVKTENNADIYFNGKMVGTGEWQTQLPLHLIRVGLASIPVLVMSRRPITAPTFLILQKYRLCQLEPIRWNSPAKAMSLRIVNILSVATRPTATPSPFSE